MRKTITDYTPEEHMFIAVIQRAFVDVVLLRKHGKIIGWEAADDWPKRKKGEIVRVYCDNYRYKSDVEQLLWLFKSGGICAIARIVGNYDTKEQFMDRCDMMSVEEAEKLKKVLDED